MNKHNIWKEFSEYIGGKLIISKDCRSDKTEIIYKNWIINFDNYRIESGKYSSSLTRVTAKISTLDNFRFEICPNNFIDLIGKLFGAQDVQIGEEDFDRKFIIKSNNSLKIKEILQDILLLSSIQTLKKYTVEITDKEGIWGEQLPENEYLLAFHANGFTIDFDELKNILNLTKGLLDKLQKIKSIK